MRWSCGYRTLASSLRVWSHALSAIVSFILRTCPHLNASAGLAIISSMMLVSSNGSIPRARTGAHCASRLQSKAFGGGVLAIVVEVVVVVVIVVVALPPLGVITSYGLTLVNSQTLHILLLSRDELLPCMCHV